jgi:3-polyprenyl-4-hydroxybenzoate decarboxylase
MAFDSFRDFVNALDKAGELKRIAQSGAIHTLGAHQRMAMSMDEVTNETRRR